MINRIATNLDSCKKYGRLLFEDKDLGTRAYRRKRGSSEVITFLNNKQEKLLVQRTSVKDKVTTIVTELYSQGRHTNSMKTSSVINAVV